MRPAFTRGITFGLPALLLAGTLTADTLILRDGRRVDGQLISIRDNVIEFEEARGFGGGRAVRLSRDEVLGIEFSQGRNFSRSPQEQQGQGGRPSGLRERQIIVPANMAWTDTNIEIRAGQQVFFEANGEIRWGPGRRDGPEGEQNSPVNNNRPMPNRPAAALIGRVGAGSQDNFYIGADRGGIRMRSSGRLFLGLNDDVLSDNTGYFRVVVFY
jgi:hypothetical protein